MNTMVYETHRRNGKLLCRASLTTESPSSHCGIPVLEIETADGSQAIGWADVLPSGITGAQFIRLISTDRPENQVAESGERQAALRAALENIEAMGL
jgi:hypothetical protein